MGFVLKKGDSMQGKPVDRRVRKTKKAIRDALTELMREKSVKDITVRELSDLADINRGTFYTHYKDVYDLLEKTEQELFEEFNSTINSYSAKEVISNPGVILRQIFNFLEKNADICISLIGKNGDISFVDRLKELVRFKFLHEWLGDDYIPNKEYFCSFIISGFVGMIQYWLETGLKQTPQEMTELSMSMIEHYKEYLPE